MIAYNYYGAEDAGMPFLAPIVWRYYCTVIMLPDSIDSIRFQQITQSQIPLFLVYGFSLFVDQEIM